MRPAPARSVVRDGDTLAAVNGLIGPRRWDSVRRLAPDFRSRLTCGAKPNLRVRTSASFSHRAAISSSRTSIASRSNRIPYAIGFGTGASRVEDGSSVGASWRCRIDRGVSNTPRFPGERSETRDPGADTLSLNSPWVPARPSSASAMRMNLTGKRACMHWIERRYSAAAIASGSSAWCFHRLA